MEINKLKNKDIQHIQDILNRSNKGNELLYCFCSDADRLGDIEYLSPQIWLIGRSYAASPQRHSYKSNKGDEKDKIEIFGKGDGTDMFFDTLAENLKTETEFDELINWIKDLKNKSYKYDCSENDKEILKKTVQSVIKFNRILREAIKNMDGRPDDDTLTNFISFSSKFLHFYLPQVVYIIDSISETTLKSEFNKYSNVDSIEADDKKIYENLSENLINTNELKFNNDKEKENGLKYVKHCYRAYAFACKLQNEYKQVEIKPRALDNYLLYYLAQKIKGPQKQN